MDLMSHDYLSVMTILILLAEKTDASCCSHQKYFNKLPLSIDENGQIFNTFGHFEKGSISTSTL